MDAPALELIDVTRRYRAGVPGCSADIVALDRVSLRVGCGECVGIAGDAGAGKTTLLLCAAGIMAPDAGTVRATRCEFVPSGGVAHSYLSVRASLEFAATVRELEGCSDVPDFAGVLERTGLAEVGGMRVGQLPPGMRARVALAHALLADPRLICVDAPLAPLDGTERRRYGMLVARLCTGAMAVVVAERDARLLEGIVARVVPLAAGRIDVTPPAVRTLELDVGMPGLAAATLARRVPSVRRRGQALRVSLDRVSAEEVLSACLALGISVHASRVIMGGAGGRVSEGTELPSADAIP